MISQNELPVLMAIKNELKENHYWKWKLKEGATSPPNLSLQEKCTPVLSSLRVKHKRKKGSQGIN